MLGPTNKGLTRKLNRIISGKKEPKRESNALKNPRQEKKKKYKDRTEQQKKKDNQEQRIKEQKIGQKCF